MLSALDFWIYAAEAMFRAANKQNDPTMEAASKAQEELKRIEEQIQQLHAAAGNNQEAQKQLMVLHERVESLKRQMSGELTAWERTELARHPNRPYPLDYIERIFPDFSEIHGDRAFGDDAAMICGMARLRGGREVLVLGTQKGRDTKQRVYRNFGQPNPEGYRKALRAMQFAEKWRRPIISLVDVVGAYPGLGAEERGQAEAIARATQVSLNLGVPFVATIIGEGMSGGALGIAVANKVLMLEHAIYAVISPEGCASILWRSSDKAQDAAAAMRITAQDLLSLKVIDDIIPEPVGGAHRAPEDAINAVGNAVAASLAEMNGMTPDQLRKQRREKYLAMGRNLAV